MAFHPLLQANTVGCSILLLCFLLAITEEIVTHIRNSPDINVLAFLLPVGENKINVRIYIEKPNVQFLV